MHTQRHGLVRHRPAKWHSCRVAMAASARRSSADSRATAPASSSPAATRPRPMRWRRSCATKALRPPVARWTRARSHSIRAAVDGAVAEFGADRHPDELRRHPARATAAGSDRRGVGRCRRCESQGRDVHGAGGCAAPGRGGSRRQTGAPACRCARNSAFATAAIRPTAAARARWPCWSGSTRWNWPGTG